jgi:hypothetical protein
MVRMWMLNTSLIKLAKNAQISWKGHISNMVISLLVLLDLFDIVILHTASLLIWRGCSTASPFLLVFGYCFTKLIFHPWCP